MAMLDDVDVGSKHGAEQYGPVNEISTGSGLEVDAEMTKKGVGCAGARRPSLRRTRQDWSKVTSPKTYRYSQNTGNSQRA
uniref:Uncharacterized protein n=1 Tax=Hyaloperonospora arabidopsidis (strain Emoy2) TaxID=559515 RepID=M4BGI6_HYAAE